MAPHERACFYVQAQAPQEKLAFYFAVQSGGNFDIDYEVTNPAGGVVLDGQKERQGDFVFAARSAGEHAFCFSNTMSSFAEKMLDFDVTAEHETQADHPSRQNPLPNAAKQREQAAQSLSTIDEMASRIATGLTNFHRSLRHYHTRLHRNMDTVRSTESRVFWFAVMEVAFITGVVGAQIMAIQTLFNTSGKARV
ncbi:hypothetical protein CXG81DRAFT_9020 [Caulochytrium protostelioides]|uniref:GOLD domain-containing protein n=1 Tax=Caulochytrium protostelioides TaxID=1555241 RepID=A0A4P9XF49_9FUNG|nr:hypothetical protein CXG81DRAFT_9020 [Caulochytrium protostelioides]|eukprot:RKP03821.1 hypothetical protein CXG81DRAFT_9020 [Caulochytrium protostelioides]